MSRPSKLARIAVRGTQRSRNALVKASKDILEAVAAFRE
jgi:hypothetical protein